MGHQPPPAPGSRSKARVRWLQAWPFRVPSEPAEADTEALEASLEAWHDAFDAVFDLADPDGTIFLALDAADTVVAGMTVKLPKGKTMVYSPEHYYDRPKPLSSAKYAEKIAALPKISNAEKWDRMGEIGQWVYLCPSCEACTVSSEARCSQCGHEEPPSGEPLDLSKWDADRQSFREIIPPPY